MTETRLHPQFPIYIPSKGRAAKLKTGIMFDKHGVDYKVVVEPSQVASYTEHGYGARLLVLPEDSKGLVYSRRWITAHSRANGDKRHWQIDDDIEDMYRVFRGERIRCSSRIALRVCEDFAERYTNLALLAPNSTFFMPSNHGMGASKNRPFILNYRCYTALLFLNEVPYDFRYPNNEDTDMTLQCLAGGWCTALINAYLIDTETTMQAKGGQTETFIAGARLEMVNALARRWPKVVRVIRRFGHPQHLVDWSYFADNRLIKRDDVEIPNEPQEYGMRLKKLREPKCGGKFLKRLEESR